MVQLLVTSQSLLANFEVKKSQRKFWVPNYSVAELLGDYN